MVGVHEARVRPRSRFRALPGTAAVAALAVLAVPALTAPAQSRPEQAPQAQAAPAPVTKQAAARKAALKIKIPGGQNVQVAPGQSTDVKVKVVNRTDRPARKVRIQVQTAADVVAVPATLRVGRIKARRARSVTVRLSLPELAEGFSPVTFTAKGVRTKSKKRTIQFGPVSNLPAMTPSADTVFLDGKVVQYRGTGAAFARAVAVRDGRIVYVGSNLQARRWIDSHTKVVPLGGRTLMPGLGDGHLHGVRAPQCDLGYEGGTIETVLGKIKDCLQRADQAPHLASNNRLSVTNFMGEGMLPAGTRLDRHILDRLSKTPAEDPFGTGTTRPIVVGHMDGHKSYTNTQAIVNAGLDEDTPDPSDGFIGRGEDGYPNGQFADFSANWGPSLPSAPDAAYLGLVENIERANSYGITQVFRPGGSQADLDRAKRLADEGKLTVHLNQGLSASDDRGVDAAEAASIVDGLNARRDQFDGYANPASPGELAVDSVKIFCDGVPEFPGQTAAMEQPYRVNVGTPENPRWVSGDRRGEEPSCEDGTVGFTELDQEHWTIHVHSLGNRSTRVTLDNFERAKAQNPAWDRRHTITHLQFVNEEDVARFKELDVVASMSLQWAQRDAWSTEGIEGYLTPKILSRLYPARELLDAGVTVAAGSDWPVTDLMPWTQIETAIDRTGEVSAAKAIYPGALNPAQGISLVESLKASTLGVAFQLHQDDRTGSIETGKLADLIVIDQDLFSIPTEKISDTKVLLTMLKGQVVYSSPTTPLN
jgi:predicted amidohydrolase YtcJ